eukprot:1193969-Prorocentrum_minimum.AAC.2
MTGDHVFFFKFMETTKRWCRMDLVYPSKRFSKREVGVTQTEEQYDEEKTEEQYDEEMVRFIWFLNPHAPPHEPLYTPSYPPIDPPPSRPIRCSKNAQEISRTDPLQCEPDLSNVT